MCILIRLRFLVSWCEQGLFIKVFSTVLYTMWFINAQYAMIVEYKKGKK